jgi:hypothetical protein
MLAVFSVRVDNYTTLPNRMQAVRQRPCTELGTDHQKITQFDNVGSCANFFYCSFDNVGSIPSFFKRSFDNVGSSPSFLTNHLTMDNVDSMVSCLHFFQ